jgi:hypothetical protein
MQSVCSLFFFDEVGNCRQILVEVSNMKFHENRSGKSRAVSFGQTDGRP